MMSNFQLEELLHEGIADNVVAGESLACELIVVSDGEILDHLPDALPEVRSEACRVIEERDATVVEARAINAKSAFGVVPQWVPGAQVERMLSALHPEHTRRRPAESRTPESTLAQP